MAVDGVPLVTAQVEVDDAKALEWFKKSADAGSTNGTYDVGWAYNLGLKSSLTSGALYLLGFGLLPAYAASTLPGEPAPRWPITVAAALIGLGAHFANVLPDLAGDRATGVVGLPPEAD